jgi:hypothetical protein
MACAMTCQEKHYSSIAFDGIQFKLHSILCLGDELQKFMVGFHNISSSEVSHRQSFLKLHLVSHTAAMLELVSVD